MSQSKIEWTERVWNPLTGCTRIGQGCVHCYAERMSHRLAAMGRTEYQGVTDAKGHWTGKINLLEERLTEPLNWKKPSRVFVNSMSDLFHKDMPNSFIQRVVTTMQNAPRHQFQVLTKRYDRPFLVLYPQDASDNILIGFSVCNQADADAARMYLRFVSEMGWRTWVSYEPALEQINWQGWEFIEWLVCGGESGPGARPMHPDWARSARDFCAANGIPFFFKQWGEFLTCDIRDDSRFYGGRVIDNPGGGTGAVPSWDNRFYRKWDRDHVAVKVGKRNAGNKLDGVTHLEYPPLQLDRQSLPEIV